MKMAASLAVEVLKTHGERTRERLRELVDHYSRVYGEDAASEFNAALDIASATVFDFEVDK